MGNFFSFIIGRVFKYFSEVRSLFRCLGLNGRGRLVTQELFVRFLLTTVFKFVFLGIPSHFLVVKAKM